MTDHHSPIYPSEQHLLNDHEEQINALFTQCIGEITKLNTQDYIQKLVIVQLVKDTQKQAFRLLNSYKQSHKSCLQQIQILLYQRDYQKAKTTINHLKQNALSQSFALYSSMANSIISNEITISQFSMPYFQNLQAAKQIVENQNTTFQQKQNAWLSVIFSQDQQVERQGSMKHVTLTDIQYNIMQYSAQQIEYYCPIFTEQHDSNEKQKQNQLNALYTPDKLCVKSQRQFKSSSKKIHESLSNKKNRKVNLGKINSSAQKSQGKNTAKKLANNERAKIYKTNKKVVTFKA